MIEEQQLTRLLRAELALQTRHCQLLEAQQGALMTCDRLRFLAIQKEYAVLVERLKAQAEARIALFQDEDGHPLTLNAILETLPEHKRRSVAGLRDRVHATLERAQGHCRRNEKLIQNELRYITFALDLFVEAGRRADINYGGGGRFTRRRLLDRCA